GRGARRAARGVPLQGAERARQGRGARVPRRGRAQAARRTARPGADPPLGFGESLSARPGRMNERQAMVVDAATASDLEILKASNGGPGLLDHLDRTRTRGGRDVLRRRFLQPNVTAQAVTEVQEALRYVLDNGQIFEQLPDQPTVLAITQYIESRYATLKRL